jgi:isopentenyl-diphosphate delta-isomerase
MSDRKKDHIDLAFRSRTAPDAIDRRFDYEPVLAAHPKDDLKPFPFLGKVMSAPLWISSMTGGTGPARHINQNLARVCGEFGLGMGLGSCRPLLDDNTFFEDFNLRGLIGDQSPFFANLGIAQIEKALEHKWIDRITELVVHLKADGLIIHVNPLQEWLQPEGDRIMVPPLETVQAFLEQVGFRVIVKEVGQGMGPSSLRALLELPLAAIDFAAFGGTNFARLEMLRAPETWQEFYGPLASIGHDAEEMMQMVNDHIDSGIRVQCKHIIVSGGIRNFLDGYYLIRQSKLPAIYGQASSLLKYANESYDRLRDFVASQIKGLQLAETFMKLKISEP